VLVATSLGITADELCTIYRTQFPVLYGYDRDRDRYDARGRLVPNSVLVTWRRRGGNGGTFAEGGLTVDHDAGGAPYDFVPPFTALDREAEIRRAYEAFRG
jgi:hypothetical protein